MFNATLTGQFGRAAMPTFSLYAGDLDRSEYDVVFLHGLGGKGHETWLSKRADIPWPTWLVDDDPRLAVWFVDYDASPLARGSSMRLRDRSISLLSALKTRVGDRPFVLVGHSMGGLLIKMMVEHCDSRRDDLRDVMSKLAGVIFMATPHSGSQIADLGSKVAPNLFSGLVSDLKSNTPELLDIAARYRDYVTEIRLPQLIFAERRTTKGLLIVDPASSDPGIPFSTPVPVDTNHVGICKIAERDNDVYSRILDFIQESFERCTTSSGLGPGRPSGTPVRPHQQTGGVSDDYSNAPSSLGEGAPFPGLPINEVSADQLGACGGRHGADLATYVKRAHDQELASLVHACEQGQSNIAVLVSDSTSGKTRACYEAVRYLGSHWRIWPLFNDLARMLQELPHVGPHTVIWLDETQDFLLSPADAETLADRLHEILHDPRKAPVLILGTVWPEIRDQLVRRRSAGRLLRGSFIPVPVTFDRQACTDALASGDRQLVEAVNSAEGGAVVQYVAGVPDLLTRVEGVSAPARALLNAAGDARRMGHGEWIDRSLLVAAVPGYLDARELRRLNRTPDWATETFASLTFLGRGDMSPLHPTANGGAYRLEDYLDQKLRRDRDLDPPPGLFWDACVKHAAVEDTGRLARAARDRFLFDHAVALYERACDAGDNRALSAWADLLLLREDLKGLTALSEERQTPSTLGALARLHARRGNMLQAKDARSQALTLGLTGPDNAVLGDIGRVDPAWVAQQWRIWFEQGAITRTKLAMELDNLGFLDDAIAECRSAFMENKNSEHALIDLVYEKGGNEAVLSLLNEFLDLKDSTHPIVLRLRGESPTVRSGWQDIRTDAKRLYDAGDLEALRQHARAHPDKVVRRHLTRLLLERGHEEEARELTRTSKGARQAQATFLAEQHRWHDLAKLVAEGSYQAHSVLLGIAANPDAQDELLLQIRRNGLTPDGAIAT
jgi:pimeloyl-ACP methyl ester carboxylesterase/tetratricopeptide (TPR) repeat protein